MPNPYTSPNQSVESKELLIAFAGNPNVGKSALINALAGSNLKVGNWPGVTVEKKEALLDNGRQKMRIIDLPGTYSLSPYTLEERVCQQFFIESQADVIVNVVDATNIQRNLQLTTQLMDLGRPMVLVLNMWDEFEAQGHQLNVEGLAAQLGIPVVTTVGSEGQGVQDVLGAVQTAHQQQTIPTPMGLPADLNAKLTGLKSQLTSYISDDSTHWVGMQFLEGSPKSLGPLNQLLGLTSNPDIKPLEEKQALIALRQEFILRLLRQFLQRAEVQSSKTEATDRILLNPWIGLPFFLGVLYLVFKLTFDISGPFIDWIDGFANGFVAHWAAVGLTTLGLPEFLVSLFKDGIIGGVGLVLTFVPLLMFLYLFLALLEESGYMARAAFLMDRLMFRFGLHGKAFVPLLVGFGCNVPAVYASRALEKEAERKITVAVMSFMSCGAKLPIYALFTAVFFVQYQALVIMSMYLIGVAVAIFWAIVLRRTRFKEEIPAFVMELPPYRIPTFKMLWLSIWQKTSAFIKQAGTIIAASMVVLWALVNLPYGVPPQQTVLARTAQAVSPVFIPQGFGQQWEAVAAILPGFMAKEMVVGTLGVALSVQADETPEDEVGFGAALWGQVTGFGLAWVDAGKAVVANILPSTFVMEAEGESPLTRAVQRTFTPLTALSYMVFNLLLLSCISVMGAVTHEFGSRYLLFILSLTTGTAYVLSALVYNLGRLAGYT